MENGFSAALPLVDYTRSGGRPGQADNSGSGWEAASVTAAPDAVHFHFAGMSQAGAEAAAFETAGGKSPRAYKFVKGDAGVDVEVAWLFSEKVLQSRL